MLAHNWLMLWRSVRRCGRIAGQVYSRGFALGSYWFLLRLRVAATRREAGPGRSQLKMVQRE